MYLTFPFVFIKLESSNNGISSQLVSSTHVSVSTHPSECDFVCEDLVHYFGKQKLVVITVYHKIL